MHVTEVVRRNFFYNAQAFTFCNLTSALTAERSIIRRMHRIE